MRNSNYFYVSVFKDFSAIAHFLKNFPKKGERTGRSCTVMWSGAQGHHNNIPVNLYANLRCGIILNHDLLDIPFATTIPFSTLSQVSYDVKLHRRKHNPSATKPVARYAVSGGISLNDEGNLRTNYAKWPRYSQEIDIGFSGAENFAAAIKSKYKKYSDGYVKKKSQYGILSPDYHILQQTGAGRKIMPLNEAIVFQKGQLNPIDGLFLDISFYQFNHLRSGQIRLRDLISIIGILQENSNLKLYFYNCDLEENILRYADGKDVVADFVGYVHEKLKGLSRDQIKVAIDKPLDSYDFLQNLMLSAKFHAYAGFENSQSYEIDDFPAQFVAQICEIIRDNKIAYTETESENYFEMQLSITDKNSLMKGIEDAAKADASLLISQLYLSKNIAIENLLDGENCVIKFNKTPLIQSLLRQIGDVFVSQNLQENIVENFSAVRLNENAIGKNKFSRL